MVRPKKQSKRLTCHKKYKIIKKVKEHDRKVRKKNKHTKVKPKDPGIPNSYPFKEELLKEIQEKKAKEAEEKEKLKLAKAKKQSKQNEKNRKRKLADIVTSAERRTNEYNLKHKELKETNSLNSGPVELSRKSYYKEFKKVIDASDVVIQVLDARDPLGCRCKQIEETVLSSGTNKRMVLLLNKIDLVPKKVVESWLKYLRNEFPAIAFKSSTQNQRNKLSQSKVKVDAASTDLLQTSMCIGAGTLLKLLGNYTRSQKTKQMITVGVVGFPNVGKSSVINSLKRSKACNIGNTPGVTKNMQEIQLDKYVKLLDSPGVVLATGNTDTQIILQNAVKIEQLSDPIEPVEAILNRCRKPEIMEKYGVADYANSQEFLTLLASRLGKLKKGGIPDSIAAAKYILQDWNNGNISFYTHPPERETDPEHTGSKIVQYFGAEFDLKEIEKEEENDLRDLVDALGSALVIDSGKPGVMDIEPAQTDAGIEEDEEEQNEGDDEKPTNMEEDESKDDLKDVVMLKKRKTENKSDSISNKVVTDENNMQLNKNNKRMFKQKQKSDRKLEAKMLAEDANKMKTDIGEEDDAYDFSTLVQ